MGPARFVTFALLFGARLALAEPAALTARCRAAPDPGQLVRALGKDRASEPAPVPLLGDPDTLAGQGVRAVAAISAELGADATCIRVVALAHTELQKRATTPGWRKPAGPVDGLHRPALGIDRTVLVELKNGAVDDLVLVHEALHALSASFGHEARKRHAGHFYEGATEYLARQVLKRRYHAPPPGPHPYDPYVTLVERVVAAAGETQFRGAFLRGGLSQLAAAVDAATGDGAFATAVRAMERDEVDTALAALRR